MVRAEGPAISPHMHAVPLVLRMIQIKERAGTAPLLDSKPGSSPGRCRSVRS